MKILNLDDIIEVSQELDVPGIDTRVQAIEKLATEMSKALADHLGIGTTYADWQGKAFAGLCAPFYPLKDGDKCPDLIDSADEGGDWEFQPYEVRP